MADNIPVKDASATNRTMRTTDTAGVHTPHSNVDKLLGAASAASTGLATSAGQDALLAKVETLYDVVSTQIQGITTFQSPASTITGTVRCYLNGSVGSAPSVSTPRIPHDPPTDTDYSWIIEGIYLQDTSTLATNDIVSIKLVTTSSNNLVTTDITLCSFTFKVTGATEFYNRTFNFSPATPLKVPPGKRIVMEISSSATTPVITAVGTIWYRQVQNV